VHISTISLWHISKETKQHTQHRAQQEAAQHEQGALNMEGVRCFTDHCVEHPAQVLQASAAADMSGLVPATTQARNVPAEDVQLEAVVPSTPFLISRLLQVVSEVLHLPYAIYIFMLQK
jgi:hypothetical protein